MKLNSVTPPVKHTVPGQPGQDLANYAPSDGEKQPSTSIEAQKRQEKITNAKILGSAGIAATVLGIAFKDGLKAGFLKIGHFSQAISHIISVPFSFLFPWITLKNEHSSLSTGAKTDDENILNRMVYTAASLGFMPITFSQPLLAATRSPAQMVTALMNIPHILFTLFSYTGGRALGCWAVIKRALNKALNKDTTQDYSLEQEFNSLYSLGNLGSSQTGVIPLSEQFNLGWGTIKDVVTGDFSSAKERFKAAPISTFLGVTFNWWTFPLDWASKFFDTTLRCAENIEQYQNALPGGKDARIVKGLKWLRQAWQNKTKNQEDFLGKVLYWGREASKIESLLIPPIGMASVVLPTFNKFLRGELFNKEAQEIGGFTGFFDKVFSLTAFFGHIYHTGLYALTIRLPQTITTSAFYITNLINHMRGKEHGDEGFIEPTQIRDKIFNRPWINKISEWAERKLNKIETDLYKDEAKLITPETKESKYIRNFIRVMGRDVCYKPVRERHYADEVKKRNGVKPTDEEWAKYLENNKGIILEHCEPVLKQYLQDSPQFTDEQIKYMKDTPDWDLILKRAKRLIEKEVEEIKRKSDDKLNTINGVEIPKSFWALFTKPRALWEILRARTFHVTNSILPFFIRGFVNVVDFGRPGEKFWYRNFKAQETGIREGNYMQATDREFMPVVWHAFQNAGKGMAVLHGLKRLFFNGEPLPAFYEEAA